MLTEEIIEFELKGPLRRTFTPKSDNFYDKTKMSKANFRVNYYLMLKILQEAMYLAFPSGPCHLQNLTQNARFYPCFGLDA